MADHEQNAQVPKFKDRSTGLVVFGILKHDAVPVFTELLHQPLPHESLPFVQTLTPFFCFMMGILRVRRREASLPWDRPWSVLNLEGYVLTTAGRRG